MELSPPAHGTRRRTHEGLQLGMGFDPTTVVSSNPTTPLVATQNRHASGTPSHLEPAHPSTAFSALDVRTLGNVASELGGTATSGIPSSHLERPKFQKRESGSGTPTQMEATDPFNRTLASSIAAQPLPLHRPPLQNASETEFGIGDDIDDTTMLNSEMHGLDLSKSIAIPGSSAITDDDVPSPPELRTDALGRTLPAALPSYLRIPTTSMVDEDNSLDFLNNVSGNTGGAVDAAAKDGVDQSGLPSGGGGALAEGKRSSIVGPTGGRAQNVVPFMAILLTWRGGGHNVSVTGTFANEWRSRIPLSRNTSTGSRKDKGEFSCLLHLPPGTHRLKFLVDDRWRISQDLSTATDGEGNLVNYVEIPNVGPAHTGPLSAPGEDLPDEVEKGRGDEDFRFPPAYLRASRLGKAALTHPDASQGLQSPTGLEQELESGTAPSQHGRGLTDDSPMPAEELIQHSQGRPSSAGEGSAKDGSGNRTSYYAESTGSSTGASSGVTATGHHHDLKFTPLTATRMDIDDELLDGDEKKKKDGLASWTRDIPEKIIQAQIAEEMERERLEALAASGTSPPSSHPHHHHHHHHHGHPEAHLPAPPSLPRQLEKVILNSGPSGLAGAVDDNSVLPAPNHVVLSHLTASSIKGGVLAVGTTTRYKRKYVTTVFHRPVR
ncbi:galactose metabolism- protein [Tilletia horrida]|nr:galactose metabolism- protein [Tilletia horrida]